MAALWTFNGTTDEAMGLTTTDIRRSVAPPVKRVTQEVAGMHGVYTMMTAVGERVIEMDVNFSGSSLADAITDARALATWLYSTTPLELSFADDPDIVFYAQLDGATDLEAIGKFRRGTIIFMCSDPFAYATTADSTNVTEGVNAVANAGGMETFPTLELTLDADTTFLEVRCDDTGEFVRLGVPADADATPDTPSIEDFHDDCADLSGWSHVHICEGGDDTVAGAAIDSDGSVFFLDDPGTGSAFHGASIKRSLGAPADDFQVEATVYWNCTGAVGQMGRIELYLLDGSDNVIGKVGVADAWASLKQTKFYACAGPATGTHKYLFSDHPAQSEGWNILNYGTLRIGRVGSRWSAYIGSKLASGTMGWQKSVSFVDEAGTYGVADLAAIAVHIADYGSADAVTKAWVSELWVRHVSAGGLSGQTFIGKSGDVFTLDMRQGMVLLNDDTVAPIYDENGRPMPVSALVHYASTFFALPTGTSDVSILADVGCGVTGTCSVPKRWL